MSTFLHPHWRQRRKPHSYTVEITLKNCYLLPAFAARGCNCAKPEKASRQYCDVTTIRQTRHFRFWRVRFQDGDAVDQDKLAGPLSSVFFFLSFFLSFNICNCASAFAINYTHRTTVLLWYNGLCDIRILFMHDTCQCVWPIAPIRFNNFSLSSDFYTKLIRPAPTGHIKPGPSACQLDALTTTIPAPLVVMFQM